MMRCRQCRHMRSNALCERSAHCRGLNDRPTIRVVSRLYRERTKACLRAYEKALTSSSNLSNEFLRPAGFDNSK